MRSVCTSVRVSYSIGSAEHCDDRDLCLSGRSGIIIQLHKHLVFGLPIKKGPSYRKKSLKYPFVGRLVTIQPVASFQGHVKG